MHAHHPLDLFRAVGGVPMKRIAGAMPVASSKLNLLRRNEPFDRPHSLQELRMLADPANLRAGEGLSDHQHVLFPFGIETTTLFSPLQIPVPDAGEDQQTEGQMAERHAATFDDAGGGGGQCAEHQAEVLDLLGGGLLTPHPVPLETDSRERRGLEADQVCHLHGKPRRCIDDTRQEIRVFEGFRSIVVGTGREGTRAG